MTNGGVGTQSQNNSSTEKTRRRTNKPNRSSKVINNSNNNSNNDSNNDGNKTTVNEVLQTSNTSEKDKLTNNKQDQLLINESFKSYQILHRVILCNSSKITKEEVIKILNIKLNHIYGIVMDDVLYTATIYFTHQSIANNYVKVNKSNLNICLQQHSNKGYKYSINKIVNYEEIKNLWEAFKKTMRDDNDVQGDIISITISKSSNYWAIFTSTEQPSNILEKYSLVREEMSTLIKLRLKQGTLKPTVQEVIEEFQNESNPNIVLSRFVHTNDILYLYYEPLSMVKVRIPKDLFLYDQVLPILNYHIYSKNALNSFSQYMELEMNNSRALIGELQIISEKSVENIKDIRVEIGQNKEMMKEQSDKLEEIVVSVSSSSNRVETNLAQFKEDIYLMFQNITKFNGSSRQSTSDIIPPQQQQ